MIVEYEKGDNYMKKKILAVLASPRKNGYSTYLADRVIEKLRELGAQVERISLNDLNVGPCLACDACRKKENEFCIVNDDMKPLYRKIIESDAVLLASPVYWFAVSAQMKLFIDRFYGFHTDQNGILKGKKFGIILSYGDVDPFGAGAVNALRSFQDMFRYTESEIRCMLYKTEITARNRKADSVLDDEIALAAGALIG